MRLTKIALLVLTGSAVLFSRPTFAFPTNQTQFYYLETNFLATNKPGDYSHIPPDLEFLHQYYNNGYRNINTNIFKDWGKVVDGCGMSLVATNNPFKFGQPIVLNLSRKNFTTNDLGIVNTGPFLLYKFNVALTNGEIIPMNAFGKAYYNGNPTISGIEMNFLRPGEQTSEAIVLSRIYDLPPGIYNVSAGPRLFRRGTNSNTIKITVQ